MCGVIVSLFANTFESFWCVDTHLCDVVTVVPSIIITGLPVTYTYPGCAVSSYPCLQTHLKASGVSTHTCVVWLQLCRPLRHSFSKGHRVDAHTRDTLVVTLCASHVSCRGPLRDEQCTEINGDTDTTTTTTFVVPMSLKNFTFEKQLKY